MNTPHRAGSKVLGPRMRSCFRRELEQAQLAFRRRYLPRDVLLIGEGGFRLDGAGRRHIEKRRARCLDWLWGGRRGMRIHLWMLGNWAGFLPGCLRLGLGNLIAPIAVARGARLC